MRLVMVCAYTKICFEYVAQICLFISTYVKGININLKSMIDLVPYEEKHNQCRKEG